MIYDSYIKKNEPLNEVYIGSAAIKPVQQQLSIVRAKLRDRPYSPNMGQDKEVIKFNRLIEKTFGYTDFALTISASQSVNAYTLPLSIWQTAEQKKALATALKSSKNGFKFEPKYGSISAIATLNMGTINADYLTDEEIMAILLHEIGHTFFEAITDKDSIFTKATYIVNIFKTVNKKILEKISSGKYIEDKEIEKDIDSISKNIIDKVKNIVSTPYNFAKNAIKKLFKKESMAANMKKSRVDYTNEKFADTFAAMYGYAQPLHSGLLKMNDEVYKMHPQSKNPVVVAYTVFNLYINDLLAYGLNIKDEHPDGLARIKTSCDYLKKEIAKEGIDPKVKSTLINQLDQLNKLIDDYINFPKDQDNYRIARKYYTLLYKKFGGDRREKDTDNDALFDAIDNRYNETSSN